jgi:broad specificity phosphatase PhoE
MHEALSRHDHPARPPRAYALPLALLVLAMTTACAGTPATAPAATIIVVRHAEKQADGDDPVLAPAGQVRAQRLADALRAQPLDAVYATRYRRALETAAPTARAHGLEVRQYDAAGTATDLAARLRRDHPTGTVLVVGHSNTVPGIVSALCGCAVDPIDEATYGGRYDVTLPPTGEAGLVQGRF